MAYSQLENAIEHLVRDPDTRRAVVAIYDACNDSGYNGKDMPCNTMLFFKLRHGQLSLTVANRSNDLLLGAYGVNKTQFSLVLQYVAARLGVSLGSMRQVSDSLHAYIDTDLWKRVSDSPLIEDPYRAECVHMEGTKLRVTGQSVFFAPDMQKVSSDLRTWFKAFDDGGVLTSLGQPYWSMFFREFVMPMTAAYMLYKEGQIAQAVERTQAVRFDDWRTAAQLWLLRRSAKRYEEAERAARI